MTREEHAKFLAQCKEFVLGMNRLEQRIGKIDEVLTKDEQRTAFKEVVDWLGTTTEIPPNSYTREWARELLAAIGPLGKYTKYEGCPDTYSDLFLRVGKSSRHALLAHSGVWRDVVGGPVMRDRAGLH